LEGCPDGGIPYAGVVFDQSGNLYGTTTGGGSHSQGVVFKITPAGKYTVLYSFCSQGGFSCSDGQYPLAPIAFDQKGNLYGTASQGGAYGAWCGWVNENAFATILQARPCPTFGRPVHLGSPHRLRPGTSPHALRIPSCDTHLMDTLPSGVLPAVALAPPWLYPAFAFVPV
jgi:uncharacterized repeat protein (TIGR03803 family)